MSQNISVFQPKSPHSIRLLMGVAVLIACTMQTARAAVDWSTKHQPRIGPNLVTNSDFSGPSDWVFNGANYFTSVTRTPGSGSARLLKSLVPRDSLTSTTTSRVQVTPGESYTLSAYSLTNSWPSPPVRMSYKYFSAAGVDLGTSGVASIWGNSKVNEWEEMSTFIQVPDQIGGTPVEEIRVNFLVADQVGGIDRAVWIDDVYLGQGQGFEQPPEPKTPFNGKQTRVDELGNMEVMRSGSWEPFFPLAMYGNVFRPDWSDYSNQGFNMEMRATEHIRVQKAIDAGMLVGINIADYMISTASNYNNVQGIQDLIADFKTRGFMDDISLFYWDNEQAHEQWDVPVAITDAIKAADVDANGDRLHPIYTLNGNLGHGRRHLNDTTNLSDITGTYIGGDNGDPRGRTNQFRILDNIENQRQPNVFAQLNRGVGDEMRPRLFGAIAHGARGMGFWHDDYQSPNLRVENLPWWGDFPNMAAEIDQMMDAGLIQVPHWTEWSIDSDAGHLIDFGTRELNGEGYLIAVNYDDTSSVTTFTLDGLGYTPVEIRDFFTDAVVATLTGDQFDIALGANGSGVYRLVAPVANNPGDFDGDLDVDGADFLLWQRGGASGNLAEWEANYGMVYSSLEAAQGVPEPTTALLTLAGVLCWGRICRRTSNI